MPAGSIKASTQDTSNGTPVATAVNEDAAGNAIQLMSAVGSKSTWNELARTALTAADAPTGGDLTTTGFAGTAGANLADLGNALAVQVRATCDTASKSLTGMLVFYDASNKPIGYSETISFTSDATLRLGNATGNFVSTRKLLDAGAARKAAFFVSSISGGTWAVYIRPL